MNESLRIVFIVYFYEVNGTLFVHKSTLDNVVIYFLTVKKYACSPLDEKRSYEKGESLGLVFIEKRWICSDKESLHCIDVRQEGAPGYA